MTEIKSKKMSLVYISVSTDVIDNFKGFFRKLKRYVGEYRVEAQDFYDTVRGVIKISFYTDKVDIKEGDDRTVFIEAKSNNKGSWYFTKIEKG